MAKTTNRSRGSGAASGTRRTITAAARAAAKRAERGHREPGPSATGEEASVQRATPDAGRTLLIEPPQEGGWDDPPEPSPESFGEDAPRNEDEAEDEPGSGTRTRRGRRLLTVALCALLVAGLAAVAVLGWRYREGARADEARGQALTAARQAAPVILSYDYRHLDRDFSAARAQLTGHFRDQYGRTTATVVGPTARKYHGVVRATVARPTGGGSPAASVVSASADRAVILLFVNQVTTSTQVQGSRVDLNRVRMTLTRTAGGWKVSAVDAL
ncbi:hypothetical protein ACFVTY_27610 [Streptomyces sp. NPDC058067]|uniref:hypothetical protein n=1 Tax=Streptomyces sp. NPDC058067 TaxID=3346324 RepID=UPI0036E64873